MRERTSRIDAMRTAIFKVRDGTTAAPSCLLVFAGVIWCLLVCTRECMFEHVCVLYVF